MDKMRKKHIEEMERIGQAIKNTKSEYLKRDYLKVLNQMQKDLSEYDMYRYQYSGQSWKAKKANESNRWQERKAQIVYADSGVKESIQTVNREEL